MTKRKLSDQIRDLEPGNVVHFVVLGFEMRGEFVDYAAGDSVHLSNLRGHISWNGDDAVILNAQIVRIGWYLDYPDFGASI